MRQAAVFVKLVVRHTRSHRKRLQLLDRLLGDMRRASPPYDERDATDDDGEQSDESIDDEDESEVGVVSRPPVPLAICGCLGGGDASLCAREAINGVFVSTAHNPVVGITPFIDSQEEIPMGVLRLPDTESALEFDNNRMRSFFIDAFT